MVQQEKYDYRRDFPLTEPVLQKHIATTYNPVLYSSDWFWDTHEDGNVYIHIKITSIQVPFELEYLTAPVKITLSDSATGVFRKVINFPTDPIGLDEETQYFYFPYTEPWDITQFGAEGSTASAGTGAVEIKVETEGREHNPVRFINVNGVVVDPKDDQFAIPVTGDEIHRAENNQKRRIRLVSPTVLETVIKNYEELLR